MVGVGGSSRGEMEITVPEQQQQQKNANHKKIVNTYKGDYNSVYSKHSNISYSLKYSYVLKSVKIYFIFSYHPLFEPHSLGINQCKKVDGMQNLL